MGATSAGDINSPNLLVPFPVQRGWWVLAAEQPLQIKSNQLNFLNPSYRIDTKDNTRQYNIKTVGTYK